MNIICRYMFNCGPLSLSGVIVRVASDKSGDSGNCEQTRGHNDHVHTVDYRHWHLSLNIRQIIYYESK